MASQYAAVNTLDTERKTSGFFSRLKSRGAPIRQPSKASAPSMDTPVSKFSSSSSRKGFWSSKSTDKVASYELASTDLGLPDEPRRSPTDLSYKDRTSFADSWWIAEITGIVVSILCIVAIAVVLSVYDGRPLTKWTFYFSLNTIVSTLGTVARTAILFAISAGIAQCKWIWSRRGGQLTTFELIDKASRGPFGSIQLLFRIRGWHLVLFGSITTVLALAMEPMLQAVITNRGQLDQIVHSGTAKISQSYRCTGGFEDIIEEAVTISDNNTYGAVTTSPDFSIDAALYDGLQAAMGGTVHSAEVTCPTGNCTWPVFVTIGVCSSCFDVSSHVNKKSYSASKFSSVDDVENEIGNAGVPMEEANGTQYTLSRPGLHINNFDFLYNDSVDMTEFMTTKVSAEPNSTYNYADSQTLIVAFSFLKVSDDFLANETSWQNAAPKATECGLQLCLKALNSSVSLGTLNEDVVMEESTKVPESWLVSTHQKSTSVVITNTTALGSLAWNPLYHVDYITRDDFQLSASNFNSSWYPTSQTFNATQEFLDSTVGLFLDLFQDNSSTAGTIQESVQYSFNKELSYSIPILEPLYKSTNLSTTFGLLATSLTNAIRDAGSQTHAGAPQQWVSHYHIRWAFLTLPGLVIAAGALFTSLAIVSNKRAGLEPWKTSALAVMTYGIDDQTRRQLRTACLSESLGSAARMRVRLREHVDGVALVAPRPGSVGYWGDGPNRAHTWAPEESAAAAAAAADGDDTPITRSLTLPPLEFTGHTWETEHEGSSEARPSHGVNDDTHGASFDIGDRRSLL